MNNNQSKGLTMEQLAGQRLMAGFRGTRMNTELKYLIGDLYVGGIILFARNIETPDQLQGLCADAQQYAADCGQPPLIVAVDQEGGAVARFKPPFTQFPGNPHISSEEEAAAFARTSAREMKTVGVNMDMAPVLDVAFGQEQSVMANRAFSHDPEKVASLGAAVIDQFQADGIMAVAKHFPGIGRTTLDSHKDLPFLDTAPEHLSAADLIPFDVAVKKGVSSVMLSHVVYSQLDAQWPASLSPVIANDLLRRQMGFEGVVVTDDLDMGAIKRHFDIHTVVEQIWAAGIDIALICHSLADIETAFEQMHTYLKRSDQDLYRCRLCADRILSLKDNYL
jgi:beta-N-acetylhexosaminidase